MRTILLSICLTILAKVSLFAQYPEIVDQMVIGANDEDTTYAMISTSDGGQLVAGFSRSNISGDKTENSIGGYDFWVIKLDASGNEEWQNTIGGNDDDHLYITLESQDGGYLLGGVSRSDVSGDKTESHRGGFWDYWLVKITDQGIIQWDKTIGTQETDNLSSIIATEDGGYLVAGYTDAGISGDKTMPSNGADDYWVLKLDADGDIIWQNGYGGSLVDASPKLVHTAEGNYLIAGSSISNISGDKTEDNIGEFDFWFLEIDVNGEIISDKTIGGTLDDNPVTLIRTTDNGYFVAGRSESSIGGDKTENAVGSFDYWAVKFDNNLNILWQNTIGGTDVEQPTSLAIDDLGNYFMGGYTFSGASGDKTESSRGGTDFWLVKLRFQNGDIMWEKTIGGEANDFLFSVEFFEDLIRLAGGSYSGAEGDKLDPSIGGTDIWLVELENLLGTAGTLQTDMKIYPSPASKYLNIFYSEGGLEKASVYTTNGKLIGEYQALESSNSQIDVSHLSPGVYIIHINFDDKTFIEKFIKK